MSRQTVAGYASVTLLCETFRLSRAAYYAKAERQRRTSSRDDEVVRLPIRPRHTCAEVVLLRIREVLARDNARAWGIRKVWATLRREGLRVSRRRVHALMRAHGLVLVRDREPGETPRGHVTVPSSNRRLATDLTTVWTRRDGSKIALAHLVERLRERDFLLFDIQFLTEHTARLGAVEIPRSDYLRRLKMALARKTTLI